MQSIYEYILRACIFLRVLRAFAFCMAYVSSFSYVPYVPSFFLHALHALIFSSALCAFIFDVHDVPSLFLSVSNFWRTLRAFTFL